MVHNNSAVYQINILVDEEHGVAIGKSGTFTFQKGSYVYTGRAEKNFYRCRRWFF
jgi:Uri superfamily endonuclease